MGRDLLPLMSQEIKSQAGERTRVKFCDECGEEHNENGMLCADCFEAMKEQYGEDEVTNDPGFRVCNCEDHPCCGH